MFDTMKKSPAIICPKPNEIDLVEVAVPEPKRNEIAVRTLFSGISAGTERWTITARYNHWDRAIADHFPFVPGYQRSGIVEAVGSEVQGFAVGDHVFSRGARVEDPVLLAHGYLGHIGYAIVEPDSLWKLGPTADMEEASHWQIPAVGAHGVRLIGVRPDELVVVMGQGLIGQLSAQMARLRGATVISADVVQKRVDLSGLHSADIAINSRQDDLAQVVRQYQAEGADVVIDTTGVSSLFDYWVSLIRREGRICLQGYYPDPFHFEFHPTHEKRATVTFPCSREDPATIVPLFERHKIRIKPLITHRFPYHRAKEAYDLVLNRPEEALGITFEWN